MFNINFNVNILMFYFYNFSYVFLSVFVLKIKENKFSLAKKKILTDRVNEQIERGE